MLSRVVGLDWRLDYHIRSSESGTAHQPVFIVSVKLQEPSGEITRKQFTCSTVQMEQLLARVQDAAKQIERVDAGLGGSGAGTGASK